MFQVRQRILRLHLANFSDEAADLYGRAQNAVEDVMNIDWRRINTPLGVRIDFIYDYQRDEAEMCLSQYNSNKDLFFDNEKKVLKQLVDGLQFAWEVALEANYLCSVLQLMKEKYRNQFNYPQSDLAIICKVVDDYLALKQSAASDARSSSPEFLRLSQKVEESILQDLIFLKQKLILPELSIKYPQLFK